MEKRQSKRIKVNLKAERISGNEKHGIFIENISENGIQIITAPVSVRKKYTAGTDIDLNFYLSSGETIKLHCKVKWSLPGSPSDDLTSSIGLEIINPPQKYIEFVRTLG